MMVSAIAVPDVSAQGFLKKIGSAAEKVNKAADKLTGKKKAKDVKGKSSEQSGKAVAAHRKWCRDFIHMKDTRAYL